MAETKRLGDKIIRREERRKEFVSSNKIIIELIERSILYTRKVKSENYYIGVYDIDELTTRNESSISIS